MLRKLGLIGILLVLSVVLRVSRVGAGPDRQHFRQEPPTNKARRCPGATLTLTSPVLPQALTGVTDSTGRLPLSVARRSATYTLKVDLPGFQTITRENIVVVQSQTTTIDFAMKVSTVAEEVTVRGETPVVDTKSANVNINLDAKLLDTTPGGKDIWNILEYKVPGRDLRHAGRRRQPGRPAARLHGARHAEQPERAVAERRQRRRSGGASGSR